MSNNHPTDYCAQRVNERGLNFSNQYFAVIVFLINTSCTLLQLKYQAKDVTPFDTHYGIMLTFFVILCLHAVVLVTEIKLQTHNSRYHVIFGKISVFSGALATILLLLILVPPFGWFNLVLWAICLLRVAHNSYQEFCQLLELATLQLADVLNMLMNRGSLDEQNQLPV